MCGFTGEVRFDGERASVASVAAMLDEIASRGPAGAGVHAQGRVALGHRRLGIIDPSERAAQPIVDSELGLTLVFNGCIYNYRELRAELEEKGYRFFSQGDSEVLLKAWHAWGSSCVERLQGMFAFCIAERDSGRVALGRDRLGIKPLYVAEMKGALRFASTLPALLAGGGIDTAIDEVGLHHYMHFHSVVPGPRTILRGVRKLPPATVAIFEPDGSRRDERYWELRYGPQPGDEKRTEQDWIDLTLETVRRAVRRRLVADVPVGVLLSGGLDSSLIVGLMAEEGVRDLQTFSIGFETVNGESGDEFRYSDIVAKHFGSVHHRIAVDSSRALPSLERCVAAMSEPMVSHANIGFFLLSEEVSQHVKVVQSGQGADEIFAGYHWYPPLLESTDAVGDYARGFFDRDPEEWAATMEPQWVGANHSRQFVEEHFARPGADRAIDKALRLDSTVMLVEDPVKRVDNQTMAFGLEARVPFLDHEVVELGARIPAELKIAQGGKHVLKEAARKVIPHEVIDRPKGYFPVPALKWLQGPYLQRVDDLLRSDRARQRGLFQPDMLATWLKSPQDHITPLRGSKLWQAALLEWWMQSHGI